MQEVNAVGAEVGHNHAATDGKHHMRMRGSLPVGNSGVGVHNLCGELLGHGIRAGESEFLPGAEGVHSSFFNIGGEDEAQGGQHGDMRRLLVGQACRAHGEIRRASMRRDLSDRAGQHTVAGVECSAVARIVAGVITNAAGWEDGRDVDGIVREGCERYAGALEVGSEAVAVERADGECLCVWAVWSVGRGV